ncbi:MAG: GPW/gp25 family protein [Roseburia sp.]
MGNSKDFLGRGFAFPPKIDSATGKFVMSENEEDIRQAVYIILMTKTRERAMQPEFGCNLHKYIFELPDAAFENIICGEIEEALTEWEPRIRGVEVEISERDSKMGRILFHISYRVRATNNPNNLVFPYYLEEGVGEISS